MTTQDTTFAFNHLIMGGSISYGTIFSKSRIFTIAKNERGDFVLSSNETKRKEILPVKMVRTILSNIVEDAEYITINL